MRHLAPVRVSRCGSCASRLHSNPAAPAASKRQLSYINQAAPYAHEHGRGAAAVGEAGAFAASRSVEHDDGNPVLTMSKDKTSRTHAHCKPKRGPHLAANLSASVCESACIVHDVCMDAACVISTLSISCISVSVSVDNTSLQTLEKKRCPLPLHTTIPSLSNSSTASGLQACNTHILSILCISPSKSTHACSLPTHLQHHTTDLEGQERRYTRRAT